MTTNAANTFVPPVTTGPASPSEPYNDHPELAKNPDYKDEEFLFRERRLQMMIKGGLLLIGVAAPIAYSRMMGPAVIQPTQPVQPVTPPNPRGTPPHYDKLHQHTDLAVQGPNSPEKK